MTFNDLPEAQSYALANGVRQYWRVWFDDSETRRQRARGGWNCDLFPAFRIYMKLEDAIDGIQKRAAGHRADRTTIETLWTDDVSSSAKAF